MESVRRVSTNPLELLTPDLTRSEPFINGIWGASICGTLTFAAVCFGNYATKRPMFSGIQRHVMFTAIGAASGKYLEDYRNGYLAEKDAVLRHYITLHPEDFPSTVRKKYADVLESWIPIR